MSNENIEEAKNSVSKLILVFVFICAALAITGYGVISEGINRTIYYTEPGDGTSIRIEGKISWDNYCFPNRITVTNASGAEAALNNIDHGSRHCPDNDPAIWLEIYSEEIESIRKIIDG